MYQENSKTEKKVIEKVMGGDYEEPPSIMDITTGRVPATGLLCWQVRQLTDGVDMLRVLPRSGLRRCCINLQDI